MLKKTSSFLYGKHLITYVLLFMIFMGFIYLKDSDDDDFDVLMTRF